jgi:hypothetical protein
MPQAATSDHVWLYELRQEYWRRQCRHEPVPFCIYALAAKREQPARHHRRICQELESVARGDVLRLMVLATPGSAKATYVSRLFPARYFSTRPHSNIIAASRTNVRYLDRKRAVERLAWVETRLLGDCSRGLPPDQPGSYSVCALGLPQNGIVGMLVQRNHHLPICQSNLRRNRHC